MGLHGFDHVFSPLSFHMPVAYRGHHHRLFVFKCPHCGLISASTLTLPQKRLQCLKAGHPPPLRGCGKQNTFSKIVCKVGRRPIKAGDEPLKWNEGFDYLADTVEAVREMREAQDGGVLVTAEEQGELEAALEDEAGDGGAPPSGGPPPAGGEAGTSASFFAAQARKAAEEAAAEEEEEEDLKELSQQFKEALSPSKSPPTKKPKKGGGSASDPIKLTESEE